MPRRNRATLVTVSMCFRFDHRARSFQRSRGCQYPLYQRLPRVMTHLIVLNVFVHAALGAVEIGLRRSEMTRFTYNAGEMILARRHVEEWVRAGDMHLLTVGISDKALMAACEGKTAEVELRGTAKLVNPRVAALVTAVNAERISGFPSGRLFLDSVEQALASALFESHAVRPRAVAIYRGGLSPAHLRTVTELVHEKIEDELSLDEMAESAGLSTAHFSQMFRKSTGESPHRFVLRLRVERAKEMLHRAENRVLDVAVACGFKTQRTLRGCSASCAGPARLHCVAAWSSFTLMFVSPLMS